MDRNKEILKVYELVLEQNQALYLAGKRKTVGFKISFKEEVA
jgi:hypothetical protein